MLYLSWFYDNDNVCIDMPVLEHTPALDMRHINNHDPLRWHFNSATWHNLVTIQLLKFHFRWHSGARRNHYPLSLWRNGGVMVTLCDLSNGLRMQIIKYLNETKVPRAIRAWKVYSNITPIGLVYVGLYIHVIKIRLWMLGQTHLWSRQ